MQKVIVQKQIHYFTFEEKHVIIKDYLESGQSKEYIWRKYTGNSDHGALLRWMRELGYMPLSSERSRKIVTQSDPMPKNKVKQTPSEESFEMLQLRKRIETLELQLKEAELKAIAFSTMVEIAEKEFKIPIRKKFNTKP